MNRPRYEIVRTDAGWHGRFRAGNGRIVWTTEVYTRRRAAEEAVGLVWAWASVSSVYDVNERVS